MDTSAVLGYLQHSEPLCWRLHAEALGSNFARALIGAVRVEFAPEGPRALCNLSPQRPVAVQVFGSLDIGSVTLRVYPGRDIPLNSTKPLVLSTEWHTLHRRFYHLYCALIADKESHRRYHLWALQGTPHMDWLVARIQEYIDGHTDRT